MKYAESYGWAIVVDVPHNKYMTKKSYADNFIWKGPAANFSVGGNRDLI